MEVLPSCLLTVIFLQDVTFNFLSLPRSALPAGILTQHEQNFSSGSKKKKSLLSPSSCSHYLESRDQRNVLSFSFLCLLPLGETQNARQALLVLSDLLKRDTASCEKVTSSPGYLVNTHNIHERLVKYLQRKLYINELAWGNLIYCDTVTIATVTFVFEGSIN